MLKTASGAAGSSRESANRCARITLIRPPAVSSLRAYSVAIVPPLGPAYIAAALKAYKSGDRPHTTMHAQAASLSDQDIADIAAFISTAPAHK